ncbi:MAG: hypothetical protein K2N90_12530 [Lachnospiraceae bacterium]|nr:hypothetical protein [Lachnospiraceae bacterium]
MQGYYEKLCKKFPQITINAGGDIRTGNETKIVLNLSKDCLKQMANDPAYAKKIEANIAGIPDAHRQMFAKAKQDGIQIQGFAVRINADGSMQCSCSGSTQTSNTGQNNGMLRTGKKRNDTIKNRHRKQAEIMQQAVEKRAERKAAIAEIAQEALMSEFDRKA